MTTESDSIVQQVLKKRRPLANRTAKQLPVLLELTTAINALTKVLEQDGGQLVKPGTNQRFHARLATLNSEVSKTHEYASQLFSRFKAESIVVAICGSEKAGKSRFCNTLLSIANLGNDLLPSADSRVTGAICLIKHADTGAPASANILLHDEYSYFDSNVLPNLTLLVSQLSKTPGKPHDIYVKWEELAKSARMAIENGDISGILQFYTGAPGLIEAHRNLLKSTAGNLIDLMEHISKAISARHDFQKRSESPNILKGQVVELDPRNLKKEIAKWVNTQSSDGVPLKNSLPYMVRRATIHTTLVNGESGLVLMDAPGFHNSNAAVQEFTYKVLLEESDIALYQHRPSRRAETVDQTFSEPWNRLDGHANLMPVVKPIILLNWDKRPSEGVTHDFITRCRDHVINEHRSVRVERVSKPLDLNDKADASEAMRWAIQDHLLPNLEDVDSSRFRELTARSGKLKFQTSDVARSLRETLAIRKDLESLDHELYTRWFTLWLKSTSTGFKKRNVVEADLSNPKWIELKTLIDKVESEFISHIDQVFSSIQATFHSEEGKAKEIIKEQLDMIQRNNQSSVSELLRTEIAPKVLSLCDKLDDLSALMTPVIFGEIDSCLGCANSRFRSDGESAPLKSLFSAIPDGQPDSIRLKHLLQLSITRLGASAALSQSLAVIVRNAERVALVDQKLRQILTAITTYQQWADAGLKSVFDGPLKSLAEECMFMPEYTKVFQWYTETFPKLWERAVKEELDAQVEFFHALVTTVIKELLYGLKTNAKRVILSCFSSQMVECQRRLLEAGCLDDWRILLFDHRLTLVENLQSERVAKEMQERLLQAINRVEHAGSQLDAMVREGV